MFLVDFKCRNTVILTPLTYTSSWNAFHDLTNNGNDYGSIITRKNGRFIYHTTWEVIPITKLNSLCSVDFFKQIFEPAVIAFQDGVLCGHVKWPFLLEGILEAGVGKPTDRLNDKQNIFRFQINKNTS